MPDASTLSSLPPALQSALEWGGGLGAFVLSLAAYFKPDKPKPPTEEAKTVAAAVTMPLGDPNQLRQVVEELHRLNDYAERCLAIGEDIEKAVDRTCEAASRAEQAGNRIERAVRDLGDVLHRH